MGKQSRRSLKFSASACFFLLAFDVPPSSEHLEGQAISNQSAGDAKLPAYDVVSVKVNKTGSGNWSINSGDGRYSAS